jgi:septin family protein
VYPGKDASDARGIAMADDVALVIEENGVRLRLNIVDTPGYGDQVNNDRWYEQPPDMLFDSYWNSGMPGIDWKLTWH